MKANRLPLIVFMSELFLAGCSLVPPAPNENVPALYEQFHGKYNPIRSTSSEAIDVNLDGKVSNDMLVEIPQLSKEYGNNLEIRIYGKSKYNVVPSFLFTQWWPEQYIYLYSKNSSWEGEPLDYQPDMIVNYNMQATPRRFSFSVDLSQITMQPNANENPFRWVKPESVTVNADHTIEIVNKRRLYTSGGIKEVLITTVYKRYTMVT